jgi:sec-independent protein translocase protein TatB
MLDMSWGEVMVIGGVALIVIGPKDLPKALRTLGQITTKVRRLAGEFQAQFSDAMREAELEDVRKDLENINRNVMASTATGFNPIQTIRDELKGAVDSTPGSVTSPPASEPVAWQPETSAPAQVAVSSPELAIAATAADHAEPVGAPAPAAAEEGGAPPSITTITPEPQLQSAPSVALDLTGPGMEQPLSPRPAPVAPPHEGERV